MPFPSSDEEGWPRHQKNIATASFDGADGVVSTRRNHFFANTTPSARVRVASRLFSMRASTPPQLRRGKRADGGAGQSLAVLMQVTLHEEAFPYPQSQSFRH